MKNLTSVGLAWLGLLMSACSTPGGVAPSQPLLDRTVAGIKLGPDKQKVNRNTMVEVEPGKLTASGIVEARFLESLTPCTKVEVATSSSTKNSGTPGSPECSPQEVWRNGRALLEIACFNYLDRVSIAAQKHGFSRRETSLVGGFMAGALALAKSPTSHVAGVAMLETLATSTMDNQAETYMFAPGTSQLTSLISKAQKNYLSQAASQLDNEKMPFDDAINLLLGYEELCRPSGIRRLVDATVAAGEFKPGASQQSETDADVASLIAKLSVAVSRPLREEEAVQLYVWYFRPGSSDERLKENEASLERSGVLERRPDAADSAKTADYEKQMASLKVKLGVAFGPLSLKNNAILVRWRDMISELTKTNESKPSTPSAKSSFSKILVVPK